MHFRVVQTVLVVQMVQAVGRHSRFNSDRNISLLLVYEYEYGRMRRCFAEYDVTDQYKFQMSSTIKQKRLMFRAS